MTSPEIREPRPIEQMLPEVHLRSLGQHMDFVSFFAKHHEQYCDLVEKQIVLLIDVNRRRPADGAIRKALASWILTERNLGAYVEANDEDGWLHDAAKVADIAEAAAGTALAVCLHRKRGG